MGAFGTGLLIAILAFLIREATRGRAHPPDIVSTVDAITPGHGGWVVRVSAHNLGDQAAADVNFQGTLVGPSADTIRRDAQVDYVPGHSRREFSFVFPVDPRGGKLTVETIGHQAP